MRFRKILVVASVAILLLVVAAGATTILQKHSQQSAAQKVSDSFVGDVLNDRPSSSYALFTSTTQKSINQYGWQYRVQQLSSFFAHASPNLITSTAAGNQLSFTYTIKGSDGTYQLSVIVLNKSGGWRVQTFNSQRANS